jgi:hypothetical protein
LAAFIEQKAAGGVGPASWLAVVLLAAVALTACGGGSGGGSSAGPGTGTSSPDTARQLLPEGATEVGGTVGQSVPAVPAVRLVARNGQPVPGVPVSFRVEAGRGSVVPDSVVTDAQGRASPDEWVFGTTAGASVLVATAPGAPAVRFTGVGDAAEPSEVYPAAPLQQVAPPSGTVPEPPAVKVADEYGNPVANVAVHFAVVAGGGQLTGSPATTGADGIAAVSAWSMGSSAEANRVVAAAAGIGEITFLATPASTAAARFSIESIHLNQGSQTLDGEIDAVAGRAALLRVVVRASEENTLTPAVRVRLFHDGRKVREELLSAPAAGVPVSPDLAVMEDTWNLRLEPEDVMPGLAVEAMLDPEGEIADTARDDFRLPRGAGQEPLMVRALPPLRLLFIPIRATAHASATGNITEDNVESFLGATRQWLPVGELSAQVRATPFTTDLDLTDDDDVRRLLSDLQAARTISGARDEYYHGIFPAVPGIAVGGMAYLPSGPHSSLRSGLSHDRLPHAAAVVAHELGHNMGRQHSPCGGPANPDPEFPHHGAAIGSAGYDVLHKRLRGPVGFTDYMSYCVTNWTSDYTYRKILEWRMGDTLAAAAAAEGEAGASAATGSSSPDQAEGFLPAPEPPEPGVLVWGTLNASGVQLNPALTMAARPVLPDADGPNLLRGTAADGRVLFEVSFEGAAVPDTEDPNERHFAYFLPLPEEDAATLERIELSSPHGYVVRAAGAAGRQPAADEGIAAAMAHDEIQATRHADGEATLRWNPERHPVAVVRDGRDGEVLAIGRGGEIRLSSLPPGSLPELMLSNGVRSERSMRVSFR